MGHAAGVDDDKIALFRRFDPFQAQLAQQFSNLLAFVLVDFAAKRYYGKCSHNVI